MTAPRVFTKTPSPLPAGSAREAGMLLALLALAVLTWLPRLRGPIDLRWDGGVYYILGSSLAEGKGYKLLNEPGEIDAVQYPPLLPALIAAVQRLSGTNDHILTGQKLRLLFFGAFVAYVFAVHRLLRRHLPPGYAFAAALVCLFYLYTYFLSDLCFPETLFGLTTTLFFLAQGAKGRRVYPALAGVFAVASYALRTAGIALLAAWVAESLLNKNVRQAAVRAAVALVPILCWQSYIAAVESGRSYNNPAYAYQRADYLFYNVSYARNISLKDPFAPEQGRLSLATLATRCAQNVTRMPASLGEAVSVKRDYFELQWPPFDRWWLFAVAIPRLAYAALTVLGCLVLVGVGVPLFRRQWLIPAYLLISLAVIGTTPWPQQFTRYLAPLTPLLVLSLFTGLSALRDGSRKPSPLPPKGVGSALALSVISAILALQLIVFLQVYTRQHRTVAYDAPGGGEIRYRLFFYEDSYRALDGGLDWLKRRAKPGDVVAASAPHWVYLRTGLKAVMPPFETDPAKAQRLLDSVPARYLILDDGLALDTRKYTAPLVRDFPARWRRVYSDSIVTKSGAVLEERFQIYQRVDPPAAPARESIHGRAVSGGAGQ
jgi:hypothetical protein